MGQNGIYTLEIFTFGLININKLISNIVTTIESALSIHFQIFQINTYIFKTTI